MKITEDYRFDDQEEEEDDPDQEHEPE